MSSVRMTLPQRFCRIDFPITSGAVCQFVLVERTCSLATHSQAAWTWLMGAARMAQPTCEQLEAHVRELEARKRQNRSDGYQPSVASAMGGGHGLSASLVNRTADQG